MKKVISSLSLILFFSTVLFSQALKHTLGYGSDSLFLKNVLHQVHDNKFIQNESLESISHLKKKLAPQSQIFIIDTAIVRSPLDTTRHLYLCNTSGKITSDLMQKLVGELWVDLYLQTVTYDVSNNMLSDLSETWDNGQWINTSRKTYNYDAYGNKLMELYEGWLNEGWVGSERYKYTYDANGNNLTDLAEQWSNNQWVSVTRDTYTYDTNKNILTYLAEEWNGQWVGVEHDTYVYDEYSRMLTGMSERWLNGLWTNWGRWSYTYDGYGNIIIELVEGWSNDKWQNSGRFTYTYDAYGRELSCLTEYWQGQWGNAYRDLYTYDDKGNFLTRVSEYWDGQWVDISRTRFLYTYDSIGHILSSIMQIWSDSQWSNSILNTSTYDAYGNLTSYWNYLWINDSWTPLAPSMGGMHIRFYMTDNAGNNYSYWGYNFTFSYKSIITDIASSSNNLPVSYFLFQNYPNPYNPTTKISYAIPLLEVARGGLVTLKVYDVLGNEITTLVNEEKEAGSYEVEFNSEKLSSGVYFYQLKAGEFLQTKKMILLR